MSSGRLTKKIDSEASMILPLKRMKIIDGTTVHQNRVLMRGQEVEVDQETATQWMQTGAARPSPTITIKLRTEVFIGRSTHPKGSLLEVEESIAARLHECDCADVLTPEKLVNPLPPRKKPVPALTKIVEAVHYLKAEVLAKWFRVGNRVHGRGENVTIGEPEAARALEAKAIRLGPGERLTPPPSDDAIKIPPAS
jgi:hypothetical protein